MGSVRIYSAGTGSIQYDSEGEKSDGVNEVIRDDYNYGVNFYVNPSRGKLHCYLNASRNAPEQFMVEYETKFHPVEPNSTQDYSVILSDSYREIREVFDDLGWRLLDDSDRQEWFHALGDGQIARPEPSVDTIEELHEKLELETPIQFAAPTPTFAIRFVRYLLQDGHNITAAVGLEDPAEIREDVDITIVVDDSVESVQLTGESLQTYREYQLEELKQDTESTVNKMVTKCNYRSSTLTSNELIGAFESVNFEDIGIIFENSNRSNHSNFIKAGILGLFAGSAVGVFMSFYMGWTAAISSLLTADYTVLQFADGSFPGSNAPGISTLVTTGIPSWIILSGFLVLLLTFLTSVVSDILRRILKLSGQSSPARGRDLRTLAEEFKTNVNELRTHPLVETHSKLVEILNSRILDHHQLSIVAKDTDSVAAESQMRSIVGFTVGVSIIMLMGGVGYASFDLVETNWRYINGILFVGILGMTGIYLFKLCRLMGRTLGGLVNRRESHRPHQKNRNRYNNSIFPDKNTKSRDKQSLHSRRSNRSRLLIVLLLLGLCIFVVGLSLVLLHLA